MLEETSVPVCIVSSVVYSVVSVYIVLSVNIVLSDLSSQSKLIGQLTT